MLDVQLRDHLADLAIAARTAGLRCEVLRGTVAQAGEAAAMKELHGFTRSEKESLMLLRQARDRIASDAQSTCVSGGIGFPQDRRSMNFYTLATLHML